MTTTNHWVDAIALDKLRQRRRAVIKLDGPAGERQLAVFLHDNRVFACSNRCPHQGYPLSEGSLDGECRLTCNWHNWKFDLATGDTLVGADALRTYPTRIDGDRVWIDLHEPPKEQRIERALAGLRAACDEHEYDRIGRELARLCTCGAPPTLALRDVIERRSVHLEYGTTHAIAGADAWMTLHDRFAADDTERLVCQLEAIGHIAWDTLRHPAYPYAEGVADFDATTFLAAIEAQDERAAVAQLRGALRDEREWELDHALTAAALAHYQDFGHSLIYVQHTLALIEKLGATVREPLLLALARSLIDASREDLVPEFRGYAAALAQWPSKPNTDAASVPPKFSGRTINECLRHTVAAAAAMPPPALHDVLLREAAANLLRFDTAWDRKTDTSIADNIGWLDFTHALTFAHAVRIRCTKHPTLWPAGLLQIAMFIGRNTTYLLPNDSEHDRAWRVADRAAFERACIERLIDHGQRDYIHSVHYLKTWLAVQAEIEAGVSEPTRDALLAAVNRFFNTPLKAKHARRVAQQAASFVRHE